MKLDDYLARPPRSQPKNGQGGVASPWLDFCVITLSGTVVHVVDASYTPVESEGCLVELARGRYRMHVKLLVFDADWRIAQLRAARSDCRPVRGALIGQTGTDTAKIAVYDYDVVSRDWQDEDHTSWNILNKAMQGGRTHGVAVLDEKSGAVVPFVRSGFGDGTFDVQELRANGARVGFEITFISPSMKYPFACDLAGNK